MLKSTTPSSSDDRETPLLALQDLTPVVCALFPETATNLIRVYDPYYCRGGMVTSLVQCGFTQSLVYNEDKDCYMVQKKREVPENDILITNPPYSGDHIRRALHYAESTGQPWAMLLPSYVFLRPWFQSEVKMCKLVFLCPHERYSFEAVEDSNTVADDNHVPFVTMWYIGGLSEEQFQRLNNEKMASARARSGVTLAMNEHELPRRVRKLLPFTKNKATKVKNMSKNNKTLKKVNKKNKDIQLNEGSGVADSDRSETQTRKKRRKEVI